MKVASAALAASLLAVSSWLQPAAAQATPSGTYLNSCTNVSVRGDTLSASCRRRDGREDRTALSGFNRCVGDIGNDNGILRCSLPGGGQARGQIVAEPAAPQPRYGEQPREDRPGYGEPQRYGQPPERGEAPRFGQQPGGREGDRAERCRGLHRETEDLRDRLARERDPEDRARLERRWREVQGEESRCRD